MRLLLIISIFSILNCLGGISDRGGNVRQTSIIPHATNLTVDTPRILGRAEGESSTFFYLGLFPFSNPLSIEYAMSQAIQKIPGGDTMINIVVWHETHYYFPLGTVSVVKVEGDVVSLRAPNPEDAGGLQVGGKK